MLRVRPIQSAPAAALTANMFPVRSHSATSNPHTEDVVQYGFGKPFKYEVVAELAAESEGEVAPDEAATVRTRLLQPTPHVPQMSKFSGAMRPIGSAGESYVHAPLHAAHNTAAIDTVNGTTAPELGKTPIMPSAAATSKSKKKSKQKKEKHKKKKTH